MVTLKQIREIGNGIDKKKEKEIDWDPKVTVLPSGKRLVTRKLGKGSIMLDPFGKKYR
jgi:hypothetical protein